MGLRRSKANVNFSKSKVSDTDLTSLTATIVASMTGNASFTTPLPALTAVTAANTAFSDAISAAADGGKTLTSEKDDARAALEVLLFKLGGYVTATSNFDPTIILSSGFVLSGQPQPIGPLPEPVFLPILVKGAGQLKVRVHKINGAKMYEWTYGPVGGTQLKTQITKASLNLSGLTSGTQYQFSVVALGTNPVRNNSGIITSFVL